MLLIEDSIWKLIFESATKGITAIIVVIGSTKHDYYHFYYVLLADSITVFGKKMSV